ncbi:MAG: DUF3472 domain-containing protein [Bacteroidota bacterium]
MISRLYIILFLILAACANNSKKVYAPVAGSVFIPVTGNTWNISPTEDQIDHAGMKVWKNKNSTLNTYFHVNKTGKIKVSIVGKVDAVESSLQVSLNQKTINMTLNNLDTDTLLVGEFYVDKPGYQQVSIQGIDKEAESFGKIEGLVLQGDIIDSQVVFVKDDFYWGRRGPSVHLNYELPENAGEVVWFYNEITVPEGEDVIGSYFMANGFAEGYFGIQVNAEDERRILFSVWSPYKTDDPKSIPEEYKIKLLGKGENVYTGEFGNEGSGGQSYLKYMWKAGNTYRFLLKGIPADNESTDYSAYFFAPEVGQWQLIASFRRPKTSTYLKRLHSFLENFITETGYIKRRLYYTNQWAYTTESQWHELTSATFTADATARKGARLDYFGGSEGQRFFLQNCGFTNDNLEIGSKLERLPSNNIPDIDFSSLPANKTAE